MKVLFIIIIVVCVLAICSAIDKELIEAFKQQMMQKIETCAKETKATPDDISVILSKQIPSSHEGKCIFFCMHKMFQVQYDDGSLNMNGALSAVELLKDVDADLYDKVVTTFKKCESTPVVSDPCIFAVNLVECVVKEGKAVGLDESLIQ